METDWIRRLKQNDETALCETAATLPRIWRRSHEMV